ncbi:MAG TPA: DUF5698 domain-containing protein [Candidatus Krumholzibacteria bacterium]|nr:DUF5698 domain-containing protein [Candidatus Krumholzibacteria bacterium]HPD70166.1 DUF5698 domain-containing protein [Candidatus Krumholzibacteria bacterium]HRY40134.1 DUF5698 domain-containing protein [Candidatus Krumholzibacteria bacterium]
MLEFLQTHPLVMTPVIFAARVADVSIGTLRTILVIRGHRFIAAGLGFFEIIVWLLAAGQVIRHLDTWYLVVAYAGGFAVGNIVGSVLEQTLAMGLELVRILGHDRQADLARKLRDLGYEVTALVGVENASQPVEVLLVIERRRRVPELLRRVAAIDPTAVCTLNEVKKPSQAQVSRPRRSFLHLPDFLRAGKRK